MDFQPHVKCMHRRSRAGRLSGLRHRPPAANQSGWIDSPPAETENVGDGGPTTTASMRRRTRQKKEAHRLAERRREMAHRQPAGVVSVGPRSRAGTGRTTPVKASAGLIPTSLSFSDTSSSLLTLWLPQQLWWVLWGSRLLGQFSLPALAVVSALLFFFSFTPSSPVFLLPHPSLLFFLSLPLPPALPPRFLSHPGFNV